MSLSGGYVKTMPAAMGVPLKLKIIKDKMLNYINYIR
jgi:hypothetical protein